MVALALDIREAFNFVLPKLLIDELKELKVPGRCLDVISFLISENSLFCDLNCSNPSVCKVSFPQRDIISPNLLGLALRLLTDQLPDWVKGATYADDYFISVRSTSMRPSPC